MNMTPEQAQKNFHWCKYDKQTNTIELYLDNYMLSGARLCEAKFYLEHIQKIKPRYQHVEETEDNRVIRKPWFLDFGEFIHWCLEQFYENFKQFKQAPKVDDWINCCKSKWLEMKMDEYEKSISDSDRKKYEEVHGWEGIAGLLIQYYVYYMDMRLRVIDTEITFGHNKEVLIGQFDIYKPWLHHAQIQERWIVKCYLTGRIDLLVDNGYKIGPVDHKTTHSFDGFEHQDFNPHDGMTGYILAIHEILKNYTRDIIKADPPVCLGGWIQHISAKTPSQPRDKSKQPGPRFKTTPIDKTQGQLDDYKQRQLSTFKRVAELLFNDKTPEWNTLACNNIFFRSCEYKPIHEQPSQEWQGMIDRFYTIGSGWDTREYSNKK